MRTFAELEQDDGSVTAAEVGEVLDHYATSGAGIVARVVIGLIGRTEPNQNMRLCMKKSAEKGRDDQTRRRFFLDADAYGQVIQYLDMSPL